MLCHMRKTTHGQEATTDAGVTLRGAVPALHAVGAARVPGFVLVLLALVLAGCMADPGPGVAPTPTGSSARQARAPVDPELALATFDSAWSRINNSYYDPTFRGLDWAGVRAELRPRARQARSMNELREVIGEMLARIGDSHFGLIPQEAADALDPDSLRAGSAGRPADAGLELRFVGDQLVVTRVERGGAAGAAGVQPGWVVETIAEREMRTWRDALARIQGEAERNTARTQVLWQAMQLLQGSEGSTVALRFRDGRDRPVTRELVRRQTPGEPVRFGHLPTFLAHLEHERLPLGESCVGVIRFNIWMTPVNPLLERAMGELSGCAGIVLDLRGNPGGVAGMVMGTSGYFLREVIPLGVMRTRQNEIRFVSIPRRTTSTGVPVEPYAGRLAILVDRMSMSTSEIFAAGMQGLGRARLFGEATPGLALPALMIRLPNDDVLMHAFADFTGPGGERIEGRGAIPDEPVPLTRADLLAGRDRPLEAAIAWIREAADVP